MGDSSAADRAIPFPGGVPPSTVRGIAEYVKHHYLDVNMAALAGGAYRETVSKDGSTAELDWEFSPPIGEGSKSELLRGKQITLVLSSSAAKLRFKGLEEGDQAGLSACARVADDIEVMTSLYLTKTKTTSLYFVFSQGNSGTGDAPASQTAGSDVLRRILSGNMMNLYLLIMAASFGLFVIFGDSAIFAVLAIQLAALFYSDRMALLVGKVRPTEENPKVTVVSVQVSEEMKGLVAKFAGQVVAQISGKLQSALSQRGLEGDAGKKAAEDVLSSSGLKTTGDSVRVVTRDVYSLVKGVAERFKLPVPKITIVNTVADNAAATGVSPGRSSITITAGSLEDLTDDELSSVVGHELGHIKGRDSLILFCATFFLFVGGLYLWLPLLLSLGIVYYVLIFAVIFSIGKVLETRADTESVEKLGEPKVLASALTTIGFRELYSERYSRGARVIGWLSFDSHPPIYFRIQRLSALASSGKRVGHTLLVSLRDCVTGFLDSLV